jgi:hypothetical protein
MFDASLFWDYYKTKIEAIGIPANNIITGYVFRDEDMQNYPSAAIIMGDETAEHRNENEFNTNVFPNCLYRNWHRTIELKITFRTNIKDNRNAGLYLERILSLFYREAHEGQITIGTDDINPITGKIAVSVDQARLSHATRSRIRKTTVRDAGRSIYDQAEMTLLIEFPEQEIINPGIGS